MPGPLSLWEEVDTRVSGYSGYPSYVFMLNSVVWCADTEGILRVTGEVALSILR